MSRSYGLKPRLIRVYEDLGMLKRGLALAHEGEHVARTLPRVRWVPPGDPLRGACSSFVRERFQATHGVADYRVPRNLIALVDAEEKPLATAGVSFAADGPLLAEKYLSGAVESELARLCAGPVCRTHVAEVGALAATNSRAARWIALLCVPWLEARGVRWGIFTATRVVRHHLACLGLLGSELAVATPDCLTSDEAARWGRYYQSDPRVIAVSLGQAQGALREVGAPRRCGPRAETRVLEAR